MRAVPSIAAGTRHVFGVGLQAILIAAIVGLVALAMSAVYKPAGIHRRCRRRRRRSFLGENHGA